MEASIPDFDIMLPATLFYICRLENQRWARVRSRGVRGESVLAGAFVDWTYFLSLFFSWTFLIAFGIEFGVTSAIALLTMVVVLGFVYSGISTLLMEGESIVVWMLGTVGVWPTGIWLSTKLSWF